MTENIQEPINWEIPSNLTPEEAAAADRAAEAGADDAAADGAWNSVPLDIVNADRAERVATIMKRTSIEVDAYEPLGVDSSERSLARFGIKHASGAESNPYAGDDTAVTPDEPLVRSK